MSLLEQRMIRAFGIGRWPLEKVIPEGCSALVRRLFEEMNARRVTFGELGRSAGISDRTIAEWAERDPQLGNFEAALNALDLELCIRPRTGSKGAVG